MARKAAKRREDGTVRQLPSGRWQARAWDKAEGKQRSAPRTFDTKMDAVAWLDKGDRSVPGSVAPKSDPTLAQYAEQWLNDRAADLKARTREEYASLLRRLILPSLGEVRVASLTPATVREWFADLDPTKPTQRRHAYARLSGICRTAVEDEVLQPRPAGSSAPRSCSARRRRRCLTASNSPRSSRRCRSTFEPWSSSRRGAGCATAS
jgi:hypothetical protein